MNGQTKLEPATIPGEATSPLHLRQVTIGRPLDPANALESIIIDYADLAWQSLATTIANGRQSTVMHFQGGPRALNALRDRYIEDPPPELEMVQVLEETRGSLVIFETERSGVGPTDISCLIYEFFGHELVARVGKSRNGATWQLLVLIDDRVPGFLERLKSAGQALAEQLDGRMPTYQLTGLSNPSFMVHVRDSLSPAEDTALRLAVDRGYFDQPKRIGVAQIGRELRMPGSTAHYHLQRAQRKIIKGFVDGQRRGEARTDFGTTS